MVVMDEALSPLPWQKEMKYPQKMSVIWTGCSVML